MLDICAKHHWHMLPNTDGTVSLLMKAQEAILQISISANDFAAQVHEAAKDINVNMEIERAITQTINSGSSTSPSIRTIMRSAQTMARQLRVLSEALASAAHS